MDRRNFLKGSVAALPIVTGAAAMGAVLKPEGRRFSMNKGDPGEANYAQALEDKQIIRVFLNGEEQKKCFTADEAQGMIVRVKMSRRGKPLVNLGTREFVEETVYGDVRIVLEAREKPADA